MKLGRSNSKFGGVQDNAMMCWAMAQPIEFILDAFLGSPQDSKN